MNLPSSTTVQLSESFPKILQPLRQKKEMLLVLPHAAQIWTVRGLDKPKAYIYWVEAYVRAGFVLDDFFPTRIVCWLCVRHYFIAFVFLYQFFLEFSYLN
jgi:hypothetical protein